MLFSDVCLIFLTALRTQSELQAKLTAAEANSHRLEEMLSLEKRKVSVYTANGMLAGHEGMYRSIY